MTMSEEEEEEEETFGMLHFSVAYLKDKSILEVDVIQAVDLPALDHDGICIAWLLIIVFIFGKYYSCISVY